LTPEQLTRSMVATIGHELRTPLTAIRGYVETLLQGDLDAATARRFLQTARRETLRLERLVDGMLQFSSFDLHKSSHGARCDVVEQIQATIEMVAPLAAARGVTIQTHLPAEAPAHVDGDACVHALTNLVENAVKHGSECGRVQVRCSRGDGFVEVVVEDDGSGVAPSQHESIFMMGVCSQLPGRSGSGIGLAVVKAIAERFRGDVRVESSSLGGARFILRLPEAG
jgi:two-component system, OmpR family, phosphate regulon sensor histidine kinase PhoR